MKSPTPADPTATLRVRLERADAQILRLELDRVNAQQTLEGALESGEPSQLVAAQATVSEVADALVAAQTYRNGIAAQLAPLERAKAEDAACRQIVQLSKVARQGLEERNQDVAELAGHLLKVVAQQVDRQEQFGGVLHRVQQVAQEALGVNLIGTLYGQSLQDGAAREALLRRLQELGADVETLTNGWDCRRNPEHYGYWIEQMLTTAFSYRAQLRHVAENAEQDQAIKARLEAAHVA